MNQKTLQLAHIINPVSTEKGSDLAIAQPITFESMRIAREVARPTVKVDIYTSQYAEDRAIIPSHFVMTDDLERSVLDIADFSEKRKLPLLIDILDRLYDASDSDYFIYTNVDIALMPQFYLVANMLIKNGLDAFVINRRTIPATFTNAMELPLMYSTIGLPHPGFDCFVFKRDMYPDFLLGNVCVGMAWVGRILLVNLMVHAKRYQLIKDAHLTFHIGDDQAWRNDKYNDYFDFNTREGKQALSTLDEKYGPFDRATLPGIYLVEK